MVDYLVLTVSKLFLAKAMAEDKTHITINNMMGTFNFMSPEVIESYQSDSGENVVKFNYKAEKPVS